MAVARRLGAAAAVAIATVVLSASPAAAHGAASDDAPATNYRSVVTDAPDLAGVTIRTVEAGSQLEIVNAGDAELVVFDYDGRPYLRIGPDGVFENRNSPATYLNQNSDASVLPPEGIGDGPPRWQQMSEETSWRWHDHRAHWMGGDPPLVTARPDRRQTVAEWTVPLGLGDRRVEVAGVTEWVPGPSPWPWAMVTVGFAAALVALVVRRRVATAIVAVTLAVAASSIAIAVGSWHATAESTLGKVPMLMLPILVISLLLGACVLARDRPSDALILAAGASATAALTTALNSIDWLTRSQIPTELSPPPARGAVALTLGAGIGLTIAALWTIAWPLLRQRFTDAPSHAGETTDGGALVDAPDGQTSSHPVGVSAPDHTVALAGSSRIRRTLLIGFVVTMLGVGITGQLALDRPVNGEGGVAAICRAIATAPDDGGDALRAEFAGPAHDELHDLAARLERSDRELAGELLRAKQRIEAELASGGDLDPGPALPDVIRRSSEALDVPVPDDCTQEPS